jgi:small subunit ribosomal protein S19
MSRSIKKGPYIDQKLMQKVKERKAQGSHEPIRTWARACTIPPDFVSVNFLVHNGKSFIKVFVTEDMVGHKLGEFALTRMFRGHTGRRQK